MDIDQKIKQGIQLARESQRAEAEAVFAEVLASQPRHETALIWKAAVAENPAEAVRCLELALQVNPQNRRAQAGLEWAQRRLKAAKVTQFPGTISADNLNSFKTELPTLDHSPSVSVAPRVNAAVSNSSATELPEPLNLTEKIRQRNATANISTPSATAATQNSESEIAPKLPNIKAKTETSDQTPPYKKSRFRATNEQNIKTAEHAANLPKSDEVLNGKDTADDLSFLVAGGKQLPRKNSFFRRRGVKPPRVRTVTSQVTPETYGPPIAFSVSERLQERPETVYKVNVWLPLALFVVAVLLGGLAFLVPPLSALIGVAALILTVMGIVLFNRAEL